MSTNLHDIATAIVANVSHDNCPSIGIRIVSQDWEAHELNEDGTLKPSRVWGDGYATDNYCSGTSVVQLPLDSSDFEYADDDDERLRLVMEALEKIQEPLSMYSTWGDTLLIVTYTDGMEGNDPHEIEAFNPIVMASLSNN